MIHFREVFKLFFVFLCLLFCRIARGRQPAPTLTLTLTLTLTTTVIKARDPTRAQVRIAFWKTKNKCADHLEHRNVVGILSGMICGVGTSQALLSKSAIEKISRLQSIQKIANIIIEYIVFPKTNNVFLPLLRV